MKKFSIILLILTVLLSSCRNDIDDFTSELIKDPPEVFIENTIRGKVVDEAGEPVSNILVTINNETTNSAFDGTFKFTQTRVKKSGDIVKASSPLHFEGVSQSNFAADGNSYVEIRLMEKGIPEIIDPTKEQTVSQANGLEINIPANSIVTPSGQNYNGAVNVFARWIDPTDENMGNIMPGALNAINEDGEERVLASYGMLALDLETESGGSLDIKEGALINIEMPIPPELLESAPEDMPLWEYDLEEGKWLEKGICIKEGNYYTSAISQTGYWNCDIPLEAICLSAQILNADTTVASFLKVVVEDLTDNFIYCGYTNSEGAFCGSVPRAALLKISIKDHCDNVLHEEEIGPFSTDTELEDVYLEGNLSDFFINVIGSISHCISTDVPQGHLGVRYPGTLKIYPFDNGIFDIDIGLKCIAFPEIELTIYSTTETESTITTTVNTDSDVDLGLQATCENLVDSFGLEVDGVSYFTSPTQYYLKPNQTTEWMVLEGLSGAGKFTLELRDYQGIGQYTDNVFFKTVNENLTPDFHTLDGASPDVTVNITEDDGEFIVGNLSGTAIDSANQTRNISGDFVIKKAP